MLYKRYKMLQKYINGEAQEEYKQGELISEVTFDTLEGCNEGNQKPDEPIEGNEYQWVTISDDYICNGKDKYTKEKEQTSSDGGATWTDTGRTRQGNLIQVNSDDCDEPTVETRWVVIDGQHECVGYDKYAVEKKQQSTDGGTTWTDVVPLETQTGSLIEANSEDCGYQPTIEYRWVVVDEQYICVGFDKHSMEKKQQSVDGGTTWTDVVPTETRAGELLEANSEDCGYVPPTPGGYENQYLTFDIVTAGTIVWKTESPLNVKKISYSINNGEWTEITPSTTGVSFNVSVGDKVRFKGNNTAYGASDTGSNTFNGSTASFNVQGNIMSLTNGDLFASATTISDYTFVSLFNKTKVVNAKNLILPATTLTSHCYYGMFQGCTSLVTAPTLPATTLAENCYEYMFRETNLTTAPELPATTLANYCYSSMFYGCTSLTTAPELSATTLANNCYYFMFYGCTNLVNAPELPATTLARECYDFMFRGCTSLTTAPELPALNLVYECYDSMFDGCTKLNYIKAMFVTKPGTDYTYNWVRGVASSGTFVKNSEATWNFTGTSGIPTGWTVINE